MNSGIGARSGWFNRALAELLPPLSRLGQSMQRQAYTGLPAFAAALGGLSEVQINALLAPAWRDLLIELRRMESRGEIRGGRFISSFIGEQFALPEALDLLRAIRRTGETAAAPDMPGPWAALHQRQGTASVSPI